MQFENINIYFDPKIRTTKYIPKQIHNLIHSQNSYNEYSKITPLKMQKTSINFQGY